MLKRKPIGPSAQSPLRSLVSPVFMICTLILVAAAIGLRPGMAALALRYRKHSITLRKPLDPFDVSRLPSFQQAYGKPPLVITPEAVDTDDFVFVRLEDKDALGPDREASLFVTYYSNPQDKVPHTPEVCYRQGGAVVERMTTITLDTPGLAPENPQIKARLLVMRKHSTHIVIIYAFCANGRFRYDREQVRWIIAWPGDRYIYFSKVEAIVFCNVGGNLTPPIERCKKLLREALSVLVAEHYPDNKVFKRN